MLSFCKPQLDVCGVDSSDEKKARKSEIWDYVLAKLAAMKVDACTTEVKECLTDEDRCGADYSKCVGLSTEQIIRMCPYDKLVGCKNVYDKDLTTNEVYENLNNVIQGIVLNIDNEMLATCQAAVDAAAIRVCGENLDCGNLINLDLIGTTSLDYKICEYVVVNEDVLVSDHCHRDQSLIPDVDLGRVEYSASGELGPVVPYTIFIDVPIYWESITVGLDGKFAGLDDYMSGMGEACPARYIWDRATRKPIVVPDKAMDDFIRVSRIMADEALYLDDLGSKIREGQKVRVKNGPLAGHDLEELTTEYGELLLGKAVMEKYNWKTQEKKLIDL